METITKSPSGRFVKRDGMALGYVVTAALAMALASPALAQAAPSTEDSGAASRQTASNSATLEAEPVGDSSPQGSATAASAGSGLQGQVGGSTASVEPTPSGQIGEIIVTANRRSETVQKSALPIQAFSAETVLTQGVSQATDLSKLVQGLQIGLSGSSSQIYIRGIGDTSGNALSNPGVAFNVDGVYVGRPEAVTSNSYDVARIEVLKGPQGTLYGRNTSGGAINLITVNPDFDGLHGKFNVSVGNYDLFHVQGAANVPLGENLAARVAVNRIKRNGYLTDGTMDDDQFAGRVKLLYAPSDTVSLLLERILISLDHSRTS